MTATLFIEVDHVFVTGRVLERTADTIEVELLWPLGRLLNARTVMAAARRRIDYTTLYGDKVAADLLEEMYRSAIIVESRMNDLRSRWHALKGQHSRRLQPVRSVDSYAKEQARLRQLRDACEFSPTEYQKATLRLKYEFEEWQHLIADSVEWLFSECGLHVSADLQAQLMTRIDPTFSTVVGDVYAF